MDAKEWFEVAKYIGAGATFVLGPACWILWKALREEMSYSRTRDRETLTVLASISDLIRTGQDGQARLSAAVHELTEMVQNRLVEKDERKIPRA